MTFAALTWPEASVYIALILGASLAVSVHLVDLPHRPDGDPTRGPAARPRRRRAAGRPP